jgi:hypothetical protein
MPLARNDEITTLSSIARDDNIIIAQSSDRLATREKMPMNIKRFFSTKHLLGFTVISGYLPDIAVIAQSIGIFYE